MSHEKVEPISRSQFLLMLHSVPQIGEKTLARLLRHHSQKRFTAEESLSFSAEEWIQRFDLHPYSAAYIVQNRDALIAKSAEMARSIRAYPLQLLTMESATYPAYLEAFDDSPSPLLYALGNVSLLNKKTLPGDNFTFTIAVSNGASSETLALQDKIALELVQAGGIPVTGHDRMPYKRLALSAQRLNRPILYVLDRGMREALGPEFDRPPFSAARIRDAVFDTSRDLALSSFRLDDHSLGANNRRRDQILFALSELIIALDVRGGGGMYEECLRSFQKGKRVFISEAGRDGNSALLSHGCSKLPDDSGWIKHLTNNL